MLNEIRKTLDKRLKLCNQAVELARGAKVLSDQSIAAAHSNQKNAANLLKKAKAKIGRLKKLVSQDQTIVTGGGQINLAFQEYAEAEILFAVLAGKAIPKPMVPAEAYLPALGDAVGEMHRAFLVAKKSGETGKADFIIKKAAEINDILQNFDYPDFVVSGLRRKKDKARIILNQMLGAE